LHLVGHFRKLYHDARNHEYPVQFMKKLRL